jgi:hypothetical protein
VPAPHDAVQGIKGMIIADRILRKYNAVGMLIGGLAKEVWSGTYNPNQLLKHKDVDVLVLAQRCGKHPKQEEGGVDWWISHRSTERPTNGHTGLIWTVLFKMSVEKNKINPGLYICPLELLEAIIKHERRVFGDQSVVHNKRFSAVGIDEFPVLPLKFIYAKWGDDNDDIACHCKPC